MVTANIVVGSVTPLVVKEIENLGGNVRQLSDDPCLYLVQLPNKPWASAGPANSNNGLPVDPLQMTNNVEIGENEGLGGYLVVRSDGWRCQYQRHPSDLAQTWLRSYRDRPLATPITEVERENISTEQESIEESNCVNSLDLLIIKMLKEEALTPYEQHIWHIANAPTTFADRPGLRKGFQAHITGSSYVSPAVREAVAGIQMELSGLDEDAANERIAAIVNQVLGEAEIITEQISDEDARTISLFEATYRLEALRSGMLTEKEIELTVQVFGEVQFLEARADVEKLLEHVDPAIRCRALETLILCWGLIEEHTETAFRFSTDSDPQCKQQGLRCLNPTGKPLFDLRILQIYAQVVADPGELVSTRVYAYSELLMATSYPHDDDLWQEMENFLDGGGAFEQAPWIDWEFVRFILADSTKSLILNTSLTFIQQEEVWRDQQGRVFSTIEDCSWDVLRRGHHIIRTRLPEYALTITFAPTNEAQRYKTAP